MVKVPNDFQSLTFVLKVLEWKILERDILKLLLQGKKKGRGSSLLISTLKKYGLTEELSCEEGFRTLFRDAYRRDSVALWTFGQMYVRPIGLSRDDTRAFEYFRMAAQQGHPASQSSLGILYSTGIGVRKDERQAFDYFRLAAEGGDHEAQLRLARMYNKGHWVAKDEAKAARYFQLAAELGDSSIGQYNLGMAFMRGTGVQKSDRAASEWLERSASKGHAKAQYHMARNYHYGTGVERDDARKQQCYRIAAAAGCKPAVDYLRCANE